MPTLARLSFFVPPAQLDDFAALYDRQLLPLLHPHCLNAGQSDDRPYVAGVFSRLFAVEYPAALPHIQQALHLDPAWQQAMGNLRERFGASFRCQLGIYSTPAGEGQVVDAGPGLRQGQWHSFGVADGLGSPLIGALLWDSSGKLWIGTWDGLSCFDGARFTHWSVADGLPGPKIRCLHLDRQGHLWIGTGGFVDGQGWGLCRFDGKEFSTYTPADGLGGNWTGAITETHDGTLWVGTQGGLSRFDGARFHNLSEQDGLAHAWVWSLAQDQQGVLWVGTEGGLSEYEGRSLGPCRAAVGKVRVYDLLADGQGGMWVGLYRSLGHWDGAAFASKSDEGENMGLTLDRRGRLWWARYAGGISRYAGQGIERLTTAEGLGNDQAVALAMDGAGQLWVGSQGGGINRYEGERFFTLTRKEGLTRNGMYALLKDRQGRLWVGTFGGVCRYDGQQVEPFSIDPVGPHNLALVIYQDRQDRIWFVTLWGLVKYYDGTEVHTLRPGPGTRAHTARAVVEDVQGQIWVANGEQGVHRWDGTAWRTYTTADGLLEDDVRTLGLDGQGRLWLVTGTGTVSRLEGERFVTVDTGEGLGHAPGRMIIEDRQGRLWFVTDGGGVGCYDGKGFTRYTQAQGLVFNRVFCLWEDEHGHLWFGTQGAGISRFDGQVFQTLSTQDGLVNDVVQEFRGAEGGGVWIATEGGLVRYWPGMTPPQVRIRAVVAGRSHAPTGLVSIASTQTRISFEFQGRSFTSRPDRLVYRYRLEGHDAGWQVIREGRAVYSDLPLGEYTFEVQAVDPDLNYSEPATVQLEVVPDPEVEALQSTVSSMAGKGQFVGESRVLMESLEHLRQVAQTDLTVLVLGETGTGKGLAAHHIHQWSRRKDAPFIAVNCGAIPQGLEETELFGHERGAFTGAVQQKMGKVELAKGGTLFLDEVGDLPPAVQVKLLHLLQEHTFERVGGTQMLEAPARIIAATNRDLEAMVREGSFRQDLYFRLNVYPVQLPPLRQRKEDIPQLAAHFLGAMAGHLGRKIRPLSPAILAKLRAYDWPGNVRELQHVVERAVVACKGLEIQEGHIVLGGTVTAPALVPAMQLVPIEEHDRRYLEWVMQQTQWQIKGPQGAAQLLGLAEGTLRSRLKKLGLQRPGSNGELRARDG